MTKFNDMHPGDPGAQVMVAWNELTDRVRDAETREEIKAAVREMKATYEEAGPGGWKAMYAGFMRHAARRGLELAQKEMREKEETADA